MDLIQKMKALPSGYSEVTYEGKKYVVSRRDFNSGKSIKIYAKELGGNHFISFNYYFTAQSNLLKIMRNARARGDTFFTTFYNY